jgi:hypothetical protein
MAGLGFLSETNRYSEAVAVSDLGRVVTGISLNDEGWYEAFIWDVNNGIRPLKWVLEHDHGLDLTGWRFLWANGLSADGGVVVGTAENPDGEREAWIVRLPVPAPGQIDVDLDNDNDVDDQDVLLFENCATGPAVPYNPTDLPAGCPAAVDFAGILSVDGDRDGDIDHSDFGGFVQPCLSGDGIPASDQCIGEAG